MRRPYFYWVLLAWAGLLVGAAWPGIARAAEAGASDSKSAATTQPASAVGEKIPSEDSSFKDFHSLGLVDGEVDIFRCASPVRDLGKPAATEAEGQGQKDAAKERMEKLHALGIRTIICLEDPDHVDPETGTTAKMTQLRSRIGLEEEAAKEQGIAFVRHPMTNAGTNSLEDMSDEAVLKWLTETSQDVLQYSKKGGVIFHCSAGHDRTGMVAAFIRMKYEHWSVDEAIAEMRRLGHNWVRYSKNGGESSWHEDHLRGIAKMLEGGEGK